MPEYNIAAMVVLALETVDARRQRRALGRRRVSCARGRRARTHGARLPGEIARLPRRARPDVWPTSIVFRGRVRARLVHGPARRHGGDSGPGAGAGSPVDRGPDARCDLSRAGATAATPRADGRGLPGRPARATCSSRRSTTRSTPGRRRAARWSIRWSCDPVTAAVLVATRVERTGAVLVGDAGARHAALFDAHVPDVPRHRPRRRLLAAAAARLAAAIRRAVGPRRTRCGRSTCGGPTSSWRATAGRRAPPRTGACAEQGGADSLFEVRRAAFDEDLVRCRAPPAADVHQPVGRRGHPLGVASTPMSRACTLMHGARRRARRLTAPAGWWLDELHINSLAVRSGVAPAGTRAAAAAARVSRRGAGRRARRRRSRSGSRTTRLAPCMPGLGFSRRGTPARLLPEPARRRADPVASAAGVDAACRHR